MARCQCSGSTCSCLIRSGPGVVVTGVGSASQPYRIDASPESYSETYPNVPEVYNLGGPQTPLGVNATVFLEPLATTLTVTTPDGANFGAFPPVGTRVDVFITGDPDLVVTWGGRGVHWFGDIPTTEHRGWYSLVLYLQEGDGVWAARFLPSAT